MGWGWGADSWRVPKTRPSYRCSACHTTVPKWAGRCPSCQAWGTITEAVPEPAKTAGLKSALTATPPLRPAQRVADIPTATGHHQPTGIRELDRVLGGGYVPGGVVVSGEESAEQVGMRARRIGAHADSLLIAAETNLNVVLGHIEQVSPDLLIVDSIQTIASPEVEGAAGKAAQVTEVSHVLTRVAKERGMPLVLVGQVTKDGQIAGPRIVEHLVDVVLYFEGDRHSTLRMLRGVKNRYGPADEVACFRQEADGIREMPDPSGLFLEQRGDLVAGTCVTVTMDGRRPLLAEVQALVTPSHLPQPRRGVSGLDGPRLWMLQAVVERHGRIRLFNRDVFVATAAGMRVTDPAADLAVVLAIVSSFSDIPLMPEVVACGEVALSGDVRPVPGLERRLAEAHRLGYTKAIVPPGTRNRLRAPAPDVVIEVGTVRRAVEAVMAMRHESKELATHEFNGENTSNTTPA